MTIKFTEEELNAIVDAVEKIDGWVHVKPLESAVGKITDKLNGLGDDVDAYTEITNALAAYLGDGEINASDESIREVISQEHDPIETIAEALTHYRRL